MKHSIIFFPLCGREFIAIFFVRLCPVFSFEMSFFFFFFPLSTMNCGDIESIFFKSS